MEKTGGAAVVPIDIGWSDVGSWGALWEIGAKDEAGSVIVGDVVQVGARDCYLRSDGTLVAAIGLENVVVVASADAVLVAPMTEVQKVREVVDRPAAAGPRSADASPEPPGNGDGTRR